MKLFTNFITGFDHTVAHIFAEHTDVRLTVTQPKFISEPFIGLLLTHHAVCPYLRHGAVCQYPSVTKLTVGKSTHRASAILMRIHVCIAFGITVTYEKICALIDRVLLVYNTCRAELGFRSAVRTIYFLLFLHLFSSTPHLLVMSISGIPLYPYSIGSMIGTAF